MNEEDLKKLWQGQTFSEPGSSPAELISAMQNKTTVLRGVLNARDLREILACAFVIVIFGVFYFTVYRTPISRLGDLIVIGSSIFIAWKIIHARRTNPPAPAGAAIVESLQAELNSVRAQSRLLGSVLWWYLLPLGIGILVCTWGGGGGLGYKIGFTILILALYAFLYRLNQRARSTQLLPIEAQLEALIHSARTGEPLPETHAANLRPAVLSMAAAGKVKPVEFKVAFWQLALWGEVGFIGIWFFMMLSLSIGNGTEDWTNKIQAPKTVTESVPADVTNRYSMAARRIVDLLNAGDQAAVRKLFNPGMSTALPSRKTTDVLNDIAARFGRIEKIDGPIGNGGREWTVFLLHCKRGELAMSLALDSNDQISGLRFQPLGPSIRPGLAVHRIFTWPHLALLVPFFLAGLLYSWLLQKLTKRAVGISTVGVHLSRGLNLILWDEIKEVRSLRVLNIRSLWLIKESGDKMIMPWTSLERPSELKAAVETFAPENHPLRKYLPLLRKS